MRTFHLIAYIVAALAFLTAAVVSARPVGDSRANPLTFIAIGLFAWVLVPLVATIDALN